MGKNLLSFYEKNVRKEWKTAFWSCFILVLLIHIYKFTNTLPNHDSFFNAYSSQNMIGSGRWFLRYACGISSYFDLPWMNGLLGALYLGLTAAVITALFSIKNPVVIFLSGAVLASSPSTTETMFFGFTADGYLLGLLLAAGAALLCCKGTRRKQKLLAGILLCLSCGIYQAYVSFAGVLCVFYLVFQLLDGKMNPKMTGKWILHSFLIFLGAVITYYLIWKILLAATGTEAVSYQGIRQLGLAQMPSVFSGLGLAVRHFLTYFLEWNILQHPITGYAALNIVFLILFAGILLAALCRSQSNCKVFVWIMVPLCTALTVPVASVWSFASGNVQYRPMMLHSLSLLYIVGMILFDRTVRPGWSSAFGGLMAVIVFVCAVNANVAYSYLHKCYEKTYYVGARMMEQIEIQQHFNPEVTEIALIGSRQQEMDVSASHPGQRNHLLLTMLEEDLMFDHQHGCTVLTNVFGLQLKGADGAELAKLERLPQVQEMGIWPAADAVETVGDTVVIRLK